MNEKSAYTPDASWIERAWAAIAGGELDAPAELDVPAAELDGDAPPPSVEHCGMQCPAARCMLDVHTGDHARFYMGSVVAWGQREGQHGFMRRDTAACTEHCPTVRHRAPSGTASSSVGCSRAGSNVMAGEDSAGGGRRGGRDQVGSSVK